MAKPIPSALIAIVSSLLSTAETHASMDGLFMYAEAPGDPPEGSKHVKAQEWLRITNKQHAEPLAVLGRIISGYMEDPVMAAGYEPPQWTTEDEHTMRKRENVRKIESVLASNAQGGPGLSAICHPVVGADSTADLLGQLIGHGFDFGALRIGEERFDSGHWRFLRGLFREARM